MILRVASTISAARSRRAAASVTRTTRTSGPEARSARRVIASAGRERPPGTVRGWCGEAEWRRTGRAGARRPQTYAGGEEWRGAGRQDERSGGRLDPRGEAIGVGGDRQVLDRRSDAQVHLAAEGIKRPEIARAVGEHVDRVRADDKEPWLGVVRIGGEDGGPHRPKGAVVRAAFPVSPRLIGRSFAGGAHAAVPGAPAEGGACGELRRRSEASSAQSFLRLAFAATRGSPSQGPENALGASRTRLTPSVGSPSEAASTHFPRQAAYRQASFVSFVAISDGSARPSPAVFLSMGKV